MPKRSFIISFCIVLLFALFSCIVSDPPDDDPPPTGDATDDSDGEITLSVYIVDEATGIVINDEIWLSISGPDEMNINVLAGGADGKLILPDGNFSVNIPVDMLGSLDFTLTTSIYGYKMNSIRIYNITDTYTFTLALQDSLSPPVDATPIPGLHKSLPYGISFTLDDVDLTADVFSYPNVHCFNYDRYYLSDYIINYYNTLLGSYNGPYYSHDSYYNIYICSAQLSSGTDTFHVYVILRDQILENFYLIKVDNTGAITERAEYYGNDYSSNDFITTDDYFYCDISDSFLATKNDVSTNTTTTHTISALKIKAKILSYSFLNSLNNISVEMDNEEGLKAGGDFPIRLQFNSELFVPGHPPARMDTSVTDIYINNTLVQGTWTTGVYNDMTIDILHYTPSEDWPADSVVYVDIPTTHSILDGSSIDQPYPLLFETGNNGITKPVVAFHEQNYPNSILVSCTHEQNGDTFDYKLYRAENEYGPFTLRYTTDDISRYYSDPSVTDGATYYYKWRAINRESMEFADSNVVSSRGMLPPSLIVGADYVTSTINYDDGMTDDWYRVDVTPGKTYEIFIDDADDGSGIHTMYAGAAGYHLEDQYSNKLAPYFEYKNHAYTAPIVFTADTDVFYLDIFFSLVVGGQGPVTYGVKIVETQAVTAPTDLAVTQADGSLTLSWTDNAACDTYYIAREDEVFAASSPLQWNTVTTNEYTDNTVISGKTYHYLIIGKKGESFSDRISVFNILMYAGHTLTEIPALNQVIEGTATTSYIDDYQAIIYTFNTIADTSYTITKNSGTGPYTDYNYPEIHDSQGIGAALFSEDSTTIIGDGGTWYIAFKNFNQGDTYSIRVDTP